MEVITEFFGGIALIFWAISIQTKEKSKILKLQSLANIFYMGQYFLLHAPSAAFMNLVSTIRGIVFYQKEKQNKPNTKLSLIIFISLIILIAILTCNTPLSLIPIAITIMYTITTYQKNTKIIRITFLMAAFVWIFYNLKVGAYAPLIGNIIEIISGTISILRFDIKRSNK